MVPALFLRVLLTGGLILAGWGLYRLISSWVLYRAGQEAHNPGLFKPGKPTIIYFTTSDCVPCKTFQRPNLVKVQAALGDRIQVIEVNAREETEIANHWGVLSVPTTFILDSKGRPVQVNHGATSAEKLMEQLKLASR
jgi:thiol-disulfide isomerase/thioredoxin